MCKYIVFNLFISIIFLNPINGFSQTRQGSDLDGSSVNDNQGWSVSLSEDGSIMAVGAYYHDKGKGTARVYEFVNDSWSQLGLDIDGLTGDLQGSSVSISSDGTILAVGAYQHDQGKGTVRVYKYNLGSWTQLGTDIDGTSNDYQGISVSLSSNGFVLAVGAQKHKNNKGTVRVYQYNSESWTQLGENIDGLKESDRQGHAVSLSNDGLKLVTGAFGHSNNKGSVRVYQFTSGSWNQLGNDLDGQEINDYQGISVSFSGDGTKVVAGSYRHDNDKGTARVYQFVNDSWSQLGTDIDGISENGRQGSSVSLSNDGLKLAVGAQYHDGGKGTARYYEYKDDSWLQLGSNMDGTGSDYQGRSVSLSDDGSVLAVGAPDHDNVKGTVRIYKLINFVPVAEAQSVTVTEQLAATINLSGSDSEGDVLTYSIVDSPLNGAVILDGSTVIYTSNSDTATTDSFTFKVNDGVSDSTPAVVSIVIIAVNDTPIAVTQTNVSATEQTDVSIVLEGTDPDGDDLTYSIVASPTDGKATLNLNTVTYTSNSDTATSDRFTFKVNDGTQDSSIANVSIAISEVNDAPTANAQSLETVEDISIEFDLTGTDPEGDALTYLFFDIPVNGTTTMNRNKVTYVPNLGFYGADSFTFKVNDGDLDSAVAKVSINVTSNDLDEDGVLNKYDKCPGTLSGSKVNTQGCVVFEMPVTNYKILVSSASCIGTSDGSLELSVLNSAFDYSITVTGKDDPVVITGENKTASVSGLAKGTYSVCFSVIGQADYEQCFEVVIGEPKALSAFIDVDDDKRTTSIQLVGSKSYNIEVNDKRFEVKDNNFNTTLPTGLSIIKISTGLECQGIIEREIFISEDIFYYPNPTRGEVDVFVNGEDEIVNIQIFSSKGDLILSREQKILNTRKTELDLSNVPAGIYLVTLEGITVRKTFKVIRR